MVYLISSMYFVPHFGHAKVYETSIWTPWANFIKPLDTWFKVKPGHNLKID